MTGMWLDNDRKIAQKKGNWLGYERSDVHTSAFQSVNDKSGGLVAACDCR